MNSLRAFLLLPVVALSALSMGCQTNEIKAFSRLQPGMEKGEVLNIMGSPKRSERMHGLDRWTYVFYHEDIRYNKEVQFTDGKTSYLGDVVQPEVSAEEQDRRNEASNKEVEIAILAKRDANRQGQLKAGENVSRDGEIRYVPAFKPVD